MRLPIVSRRNFLGSILGFFALAACKRRSANEDIEEIAFTDPLASNPNFDLGVFDSTEFGEGLISMPDPGTNIVGYADKMSYKAGDLLSLYLSGPKSDNCVVQLKDINDKVILSVPTAIQTQRPNTDKPWLDGMMFNKTFDVKLPDNLHTGVYKWAEEIFITCKSSQVHEITVVMPTNTNLAYNEAGGKSLYYPAHSRASVSSYLRPQYSVGDYCSSFLRWVSHQGYNINYITDLDLDNYEEIQNSKVLIIIGHSEYWTRSARQNFDKFVDSGKNALIMSGNTMSYQVRHNRSKNLMICYKDKEADPLGHTLYSTIYWSDKRLKYPIITSIGADWTGGGYGNRLAGGWNGYKIANETSPLFEGTGLKNGDILSVPTVEYDGAPVVKMIFPGSNEIPVIDNKKLNFYKVELLGYDFATDYSKPGLGTFIVFQKTPQSGTIVNTATTNWCASSAYHGVDKEKIIRITKNMIEKSLTNANMFTK